MMEKKEEEAKKRIIKKEDGVSILKIRIDKLFYVFYLIYNL
jgi:hypothetical protein